MSDRNCQIFSDIDVKTIHKTKIPCAVRSVFVTEEAIKRGGRLAVMTELMRILERYCFKPNLISTVDVEILPKESIKTDANAT